MPPRDAEIPVTFQPRGTTVHVLSGTKLLEAAAEAGIVVDMPCGGEGVCGRCRVTVHRGAAVPNAAERQHIPAAELAAGVRLACQSTVTEPTLIEAPGASQPAVFHQILADSGEPISTALDPAIRKQYVELPPPRRGDDAPDVVRLQRALGPLRIDLELLRELPGRLRGGDFRGTAVTADGALLDFEPGDTRANCYAVAVDVGTTTLVAALLDLSLGQAMAFASRLNLQTRFGDDVLARILYAQKPDGLEQLRQAVVEAIDAMIGELSAQAGVRREHVYEVCIAGNTTMEQLLAGIDPRPLGEVPFAPAIGPSMQIPAADLGLSIHRRGRAVLLPVIGGFVGGDTVAGIMASGMTEAVGPTLLVDIGTNGEIVLSAGGKLWAASTAAGPAFEGARIRHGMRGCTGAIEKVLVQEGRLRINVIGDVAPLGICGSALVDLAAVLLERGLLAPDGRLAAREHLPQDTLQDLTRRVVAHEGRVAFLLAEAEESGTGRPIVLTQQDVRQLQLASGAIRAGIEVLLRQAGVAPGDLENVFLAGGFGNFIRRSNAQRMGLLPQGIPHHRIRYRGNTSLSGAQWVALSQDARQTADEIAQRTAHVDLSTSADFSETFAEAMIFPANP